MPAALAIFAHPDDIEFRAAGTLLLLARRGWAIHCCNLSSGNLGSSVMTAVRTAAARRRPRRNSWARISSARPPPSHCDRFARGGILFKNAYPPNATCAPSRGPYFFATAPAVPSRRNSAKARLA